MWPCLWKIIWESNLDMVVLSCWVECEGKELRRAQESKKRKQEWVCKWKKIQSKKNKVLLMLFIKEDIWWGELIAKSVG
jgi:hypothetical protein